MPLRFAFLTLSSTLRLCLFWYQSLARLLLENTGAIRNLCRGKKSMLPQDRHFIGSRGCPEYADEYRTPSPCPCSEQQAPQKQDGLANTEAESDNSYAAVYFYHLSDGHLCLLNSPKSLHQGSLYWICLHSRQCNAVGKFLIKSHY